MFIQGVLSLSLSLTLHPLRMCEAKKRAWSQYCIHHRRELFIWSTTCNKATRVSILTVLGTPCFTRSITVSAHVVIIHHCYTVYHTTIIMLLCFWFEFFFSLHRHIEQILSNISESKPWSQKCTQKSLKIYNFKLSKSALELVYSFWSVHLVLLSNSSIHSFWESAEFMCQPNSKTE